MRRKFIDVNSLDGRRNAEGSARSVSRKRPSGPSQHPAWVVGMAFCVTVLAVMFVNGGVRTRSGSIVGRQQSQQEFDEKVRRLEERDARYEKWRKNLGR
jgi:hypothetical protein